MKEEANDDDDGSVRKFSRAEQTRVMTGGTGGRDDSEGEVLRETQVLVSSQESQGQTEQK